MINRLVYYPCLFAFDRAMIRTHKGGCTFLGMMPRELLAIHETGQYPGLCTGRPGLCLSTSILQPRSPIMRIPAPPGRYRMVLDTDGGKFGGPGRLAPDQIHFTAPDGAGGHGLKSLFAQPLRPGAGITGCTRHHLNHPEGAPIIPPPKKMRPVFIPFSICKSYYNSTHLYKI